MQTLQKTTRLQQEIAWLSDEATALRTKAEYATGWDKLRLQQQEQELRQTIGTKGWECAMLELQAEGYLPAGRFFQPVYLLKRGGVFHSARETWYKVSPHNDRTEMLSVYHRSHSTELGEAGWIGDMTFLNPGGISWIAKVANLLQAGCERVTEMDYLDAVGRTIDTMTARERVSPSFFNLMNPLKSRIYQPARPPFTQCRVCQCTNEDCSQCVEATGQPCHWVAPYLCSRCDAAQKKGANAS